MLSLLKKDPARKVRKAYEKKLEEALHYERNGDLRRSATLRVEADELYQQLQALEGDG
jgi:hypothetical protein